MSRERAGKSLGGGETRAAFGCIVSFLNERSEALTLHRKGPPRAGLIVTAYSTPQTIYDDLTGARMDFTGADDKRRDPVRPEAAALASARLGHLAHPLLGVGRLEGEARNHRRDRTGSGR